MLINPLPSAVCEALCVLVGPGSVSVTTVEVVPRKVKNSTEHLVASHPSYLCYIRGMGSASNCKCLALVSMNIFTLPVSFF